MIRTYTIASVLLILLVKTSLWGEQDFLNSYLNGEVELPKGVDWRQYAVIVAQDDTPAQLVALLHNPKKKNEWQKAIQALGMLASGENGKVPLEWITEITESWESGKLLGEDQEIDYLEMAYSAVAYEGSPEALEFLKKRASKTFWDDKEMPSGIETISDPYSEKKVTARSKALLAISKHPSAGAEKFLEKAYADSSFSEEYIQARLESNFRMRSTWISAHEKRMEAHRMKQGIQQLSNDASVTSEPPPYSSVPEVAEAIEEPVEEPVEKPAEQSSNWWLWLIGAVVVIGGLGWVLRRKN